MEPRIYAHCWTLLPVMNAVEAARFAADNGFQGLEVLCNPLDFWPGMIAEATLAELAAVARDEGFGFPFTVVQRSTPRPGRLSCGRSTTIPWSGCWTSVAGSAPPCSASIRARSPNSTISDDRGCRSPQSVSTAKICCGKATGAPSRRSRAGPAWRRQSVSPSWSRTMSTCVTPRRRPPNPWRRWSRRPSARTSRSISTPVTPSSAPGCSRNSTCSSRTSGISTSTTTARCGPANTCRSAKGRWISPRLPTSSPRPTPPFP